MNEYSRRLILPLSDVDHVELRGDLCDRGMLGGDGRARYFVSVLTSQDYLGKRDSLYVDAARELALKLTDGAAGALVFTEESICWMWQLFEREYRKQYPSHDLLRKWSKADEAIVQFLESPKATYAELARATSTTENQLMRNSSLNYLRARFLK